MFNKLCDIDDVKQVTVCPDKAFNKVAVAVRFNNDSVYSFTVPYCEEMELIARRKVEETLEEN